MRFESLADIPKVLAVYLKLSEYPILAREIRKRMRQELFERGIITPEQFEREVKEKAILTQQLEGLDNPPLQEAPEVWEERLRIIRDHLTDFYFALNLPHERFEEIVRSILSARKPEDEIVLTFNPELAPWHLLFAQAEEYEKLPPDRKAKVQHHLRQIIVVLTRGMISDQLGFVRVAREHFDISDLKEIYRRRIGRGKIGGKAAGMMLAYKILREPDAEDPFPLADHVTIPESFFIGADVFYDFMAYNELYRFSDQKYKSREEIEADYPEIRRHFLEGRFPEELVERLRGLVSRMEGAPLIVRSSSLLEDNFGYSFAGKYESVFCPNQGTAEENLTALLNAIREVYASTLNPDALLYRRQVGLVDYDERMAVLIQRVEGNRHGRYFFPTVAGVAFGRNPFRWSRIIRREDGFMRIVLGLGTRAVERVANDYARIVALSHPHLRPEVTLKEIKKYSQRFVDVIDLQGNAFETLSAVELLDWRFPALEWLVSTEEEGYVQPLRFRRPGLSPDRFVLTFDRLLQETDFVPLMKAILRKLERAYQQPVDIEFTLEIQPDHPRPRLVVHLLQCRPLSRWETRPVRDFPAYIPEEDVVFTATRLVPDGVVERIEYVVYVDPTQYRGIPDHSTKQEIGRVIGRLNKRLEGKRFILVGPGRWGTVNLDLGVRVGYADIYNTLMLIEVAFAGPEGTPEVSHGTHFFQDLVEANIYALPLYPDEPETVFNRAFFEDSPNLLPDLLPGDAAYAQYVRVIDVRAASGGKLLEVIMNAEEERALAYLRRYGT